MPIGIPEKPNNWPESAPWGPLPRGMGRPPLDIIKRLRAIDAEFHSVLIGDSGVFRTGPADGERLEITGGDKFFQWYNGLNQLEAFMGWSPTGFGADTFVISTDRDTNDIQLSPDGKLYVTAGGVSGFGVLIEGDPSGATPAYPLTIWGDSPGNTVRLRVTTTPQVLVDEGSTSNASDPVYSYFDDDDTGHFRAAANAVGTAAGGVEVLRVSSVRMDVDKSTSQEYVMTIPVKTTTGDPSPSGGAQDGDMYMNSFDNVLKIYENSTWRTVASW